MNSLATSRTSDSRRPPNIPMANYANETLGHVASMNQKSSQCRRSRLGISDAFGGVELPPHAEETLRDNQQHCAAILNATVDAIIAIDQKHHITLFNRAAEDLFRCAG